MPRQAGIVLRGLSPVYHLWRHALTAVAEAMMPVRRED
jgi:hypothetical protein